MRAGQIGTVTALCAFALSACATAAPVPVNVAASGPPASASIDTNGERDVLFVSLSGGGARAAAFALGALQQLRETPGADGRPLTDHIALISSVSGGSISAAYYGLHGADGVDGLRADYLDKNWERELHTSPVSPLNWSRLLSGGLNGPETFASWLDAEIFPGADLADFSDTPQIWLNATDTFNGVTFSFTPFYFNAICSDLASVRVADAVAASMAFPAVFKPILVESHAGECAAPAWATGALGDRAASARTRAVARAFASYRAEPPLQWLHLSDGGVVDNLGLSTLTLLREIAPDAASPLSARDAVRLRRLTVLVVNAENARHEDWRNQIEGPSAGELFDTFTDTYIELGNRASFDAFRDAAGHWREDLVTWRCSLSAAELAALAGDIEGWACDDVSINVDMIAFRDLDAATYERVALLPTRVYLPPEDVDALIAAGREAVRINAAAAAFAER
ncbi:MAG: patatin-like phospholipase family protein [Hyphomonadaceae bacterium]|nr:patatin-like phospholipase family protein [Hyphomonadaceae bacterium]